MRETAGSCVLVVVARAAADMQLAPGTLTASQRLALAAGPAYSAGHLRAGHHGTGQIGANHSGAGQIRADGTAPGALICTRGAAAGIRVLPGTTRP